MLYRLLGESGCLGIGYVLQLVYELAIVVMSYEAGSEYALDKYVRGIVPDYKTLVVARNVLNHNSYNKKAVEDSIITILDKRVVEFVYIVLFGEAKDYKVFEAECYVYLEYMRRLWSDGR